MIKTSAHATLFLKSIEHAAPACILLDRLFSHFGPVAEVEVHFSGAGGADLRVRAFRDGTGGRAERNVLTLVWRQGGYFDCNILCAIHEGGPVSAVRQVTDPLPHAFRFDPAVPGPRGSAASVLIEMIEAAIAGWV